MHHRITHCGMGQQITMLWIIAASAFAAAQVGVLGYWTTPNHSVVRIYKCNTGVCAQLVRVSSQAPDKTDTKNPSAAERKKPLCGLVMGQGFRLAGSSEATGGTLYDPESGKTYRGQMEARGNDLKLRGYIGLP